MSDTARDYQQSDPSATIEGLDDFFSSSDSTAQARTDSLDVSHASDDTQGQAMSESLDTPTKEPSDALVAELRDQLAALKAELNQERSDSQRLLQAAAFRNGYLESQLANKTEEIKLLMDSQHKSGKWARFKAWFFGQ